MRVSVDDSKCQGHTLCNMVAPEIFHLREENGHSYVVIDEVPPELQDAARKAALGCPEQAITVHD